MFSCASWSSVYLLWRNVYLDLLFSNFFFLLYNIVLILPYINMNLPQVYMCSPSRTLLPPPSPYHPSGSSQCTSPKHPVSCIEPGLATCSISTGSLGSQRHPGKFPKVPGRRRGKRGFPAAPRERPRESFFNASRGPSPLPCVESQDALPLATRMET